MSLGSGRQPPQMKLTANFSTSETSAARTALCFVDRLAIRSKRLMGAHTPIETAGKLIIFLAGRLVIHFFAP
jgi:hypothetical protein